MSRALVIVLDSVGCGAAPDAEKYGDTGANTLGHILQSVPDLKIPTLRRLGWSQIFGEDEPNEVSCARLRPQSVGKDTTSGHWELMGAILDKPFATFERFPDELVQAIEQEAGVHFVGNIVASGTQILEMLGEQSIATGRPILYTSADSVLQIAAHETHFGLEKLLFVCEVARRIADDWSIGRVIARPFIGEESNFSRTANRRDYSILPPRTVLDALTEAGITTTAIGKINDIFAGSGLSHSLPTKSNAAGMKTITSQWQMGEDGLYFANLVDFDTLYGHRRDVKGYAQALEEFDGWLADFASEIEADDLVLITADHGNDPTFPGTDHTREEVPLLMWRQNQRDKFGVRTTFADVAATLGTFFNVDWKTGTAL
ncbi:phosphopentomutase [Abditibacteriota bacterium]|nr:phosphopentomutase [Abditibacteriota bacterium]